MSTILKSSSSGRCLNAYLRGFSRRPRGPTEEGARETRARGLALARVARVRLAEDGVAEARDDLAGVERLPRELRDGLFVDLSTFGVELGLEVLDPAEDFLVRQAV